MLIAMKISFKMLFKYGFGKVKLEKDHCLFYILSAVQLLVKYNCHLNSF